VLSNRLTIIETHSEYEIGSGNAVVEIFCDAKGLALLFKELEHLKAGSTHVHLMTPAWAGIELDEKPVGKESVLVHHLRITMVPASL
jgi:hypothetical protein